MNRQDLPMQYPHLLSLEGQSFVVLGAGDGIGEQVVTALAQCGATVMCVDTAQERAERVAQAHGGVACVADITQPADMERVFAQAAHLPGTGPLGVVDVVGMVLRTSLATTGFPEWKRQFEVVLDHAWLALQMGARAMQGRGGAFVFIGSIAGTVPRGGAALAYASAKAGLHHLVRSAALELGPQGIRVNVVAPGLTRTPRLVQSNPEGFWPEQAAQIPLRRVGETTDVASAVLFLASPMAQYITGNVVAVDGGSSLTSGGFTLARS
jgi:NAD(P)-dependent dehydrogenase (short-subunit alcohol dehydrogenase family)